MIYLKSWKHLEYGEKNTLGRTILVWNITVVNSQPSNLLKDSLSSTLLGSFQKFSGHISTEQCFTTASK